MLGRTKKIHFVGIGGIGMSGIAEVLINLGFTVTGSDVKLSSTTSRLKKIGATIFEGHDPQNVADADVVVYSSAVKRDNVEVKFADSVKIPVIRRAEMLGELMRMKQSIAVAGTHGKTTTTSMIGLVLQKGGIDPTLIVGGKVRSLKTNARLGSSDFMVVEADEFDRSFLKLVPNLAVITNIESDHLDCYKDLEEIKKTFLEFANSVPFYGSIIFCLDEKALQEIVPYFKRRIMTYGLNPQAEVRAVDIETDKFNINFKVIWKDKVLGRINVKLPGEHNVKNSLAAVATGLEFKISFKKIKEALEEFTGVHRRFEIKQDRDDILVVDDYAHHPTEIKATLRGTRKGFENRIIAVFQPHLYSRTRDFCQDFAQSFFDADILIVTDIYPAREKPIQGISGEIVAHEARRLGHKQVLYIKDKMDVVKELHKIVKKGDLVITIGAGDIWRTGDLFIQEFWQ
ncbi:MAG: UDP-N-acetylmuramate--L-alanine ligase [bacterium]